jgi:hypothetical protein
LYESGKRHRGRHKEELRKPSLAFIAKHPTAENESMQIISADGLSK